MPVTYDTLATIPLRSLELLLADCPSWQAACGAGGTNAHALALERIAVEEAHDEGPYALLPPRAIVSDDPDWVYQRFAPGSFAVPNAGLYLQLELPWDHDLWPSEKDARYHFRNVWGAIVADLATLESSDSDYSLPGQTHLNVVGISKVGVTLLRPAFDQDQSAGLPDYFSALFLVRYQG